jgi:UDP-N-acetyl-D-mannosaminuronic acid dehydrogenase
MLKEKVCVVGLGYIGLPTSIVMAEYGLDVVGFDVDTQRVNRINKCDPVIQEPEIFERLQAVVQKKRFKATTSIEEANYFVIAVPTPFADQKRADLSYVFQAAHEIARVLKLGNVVILESTVSVGATKKLTELLEKETGFSVGKDFFVAHCPERVLPGKIFKELVNNARIIGGMTPDCVEHTKQLYKKFVAGSLYLTDATTAEMVKLVENSSRDVAIAFANQVASMAQEVGLNPYEVIELANKHPRVNILQPGCGVGGHCIAVDPWFLVESFPKQSALLKAARIVNDTKPDEVVEQIKKKIATWQESNKGICKVLLLGLTYKPNVDDLRESPALSVAQRVAKIPNIELLISEPMVSPEIVASIVDAPNLAIKDGLERADIIVGLVAHSAFKRELAAYIDKKIIIDYCGLLAVARKDSQEQELLFWPASSDYSWPDFDALNDMNNEQETIV